MSRVGRGNWRRVCLGEIFDIGSSKRVMQADWRQEGVPFYRAREIVKLARDGIVDNELFISESHFEALSDKGGVPQAGDLMVSAVGTLGACYVVKSTDRFYYKDASVLLFRPRASVDPEFIRYAFLSDDLLAQVQAGEGATVGTFTIERARRAAISLPPLDEQKHIVAKLDQAFAALDRAHAHAERNLKDSELLYEASVEDKIHGERSGWRRGTIQSLVGDVLTGPFGSLLHKREYVEGGTPIVNPSNIVEGTVEPDWSKTVSKEGVARLESYKLRSGDLVVGRRGEMGRCAPITEEMNGWLCGTGSFIIRPKEDVSVAFVGHMMRSRKVVETLSGIATGATMANLSNQALANMPFELPDKARQVQLVSEIERLQAVTKSLAVDFRARLADIAALRQSLLNAAFTGQLT